MGARHASLVKFSSVEDQNSRAVVVGADSERHCSDLDPLVTFVCFRLRLNVVAATCLYLIIIVLLSLEGSFLLSALLSLIGDGWLIYYSFRVSDPLNAATTIALFDNLSSYHALGVESAQIGRGTAAPGSILGGGSKAQPYGATSAGGFPQVRTSGRTKLLKSSNTTERRNPFTLPRIEAQ